jgi:peptidoglycan/LPS O-acetylase OafA/YrhL
MRKLKSGEKGMLVLCSGMIAIIVIGIVLIVTDHTTAASLVSNIGTLVWLLLVGAWIVLWDSRKRWPRATVMQRLSNVLTFRR